MHHWAAVSGVKQGDIIFTYQEKKIICINKALTNGFAASKPPYLDTDNQWEENGWMVNIQYEELHNPLIIKEHINKILEFKSKNSYRFPFRDNGDGNVEYLYGISD